MPAVMVCFTIDMVSCVDDGKSETRSAASTMNIFPRTQQTRHRSSIISQGHQDATAVTAEPVISRRTAFKARSSTASVVGVLEKAGLLFSLIRLDKVCLKKGAFGIVSIVIL